MDSCPSNNDIKKNTKTAKFLVVQDVYQKQTIEKLANPPKGKQNYKNIEGTNFLFWYDIESKGDSWGILQDYFRSNN